MIALKHNQTRVPPTFDKRASIRKETVLILVTEVEATSAPSVAMGAPHYSDGAVAGFYEDQIVDRYAACSIIEEAVFVKVPSELFIGDLYGSFIIQTAERRRQSNMKQIQCSLMRWGRTSSEYLVQYFRHYVYSRDEYRLSWTTISSMSGSQPLFF